MKPKYFLFLCLSFLIIHSSLLIGTVRYVSKSGTSTPPYTSWQTAADSIQKCIDICSFGDTVYVANGVYKEQIIMIPGLSLIGAGMDSCVIDTRELSGPWPFMSVSITDTCILSGFKIIVANNPVDQWGIGDSGSKGSLVTLNRITSSAIGIENNNLDTSNSSNIYIYKNLIDDVKRGIDLFNSNSIIRGNTIFTDLDVSGFETGIGIGDYFSKFTPLIDSNYIETIYEGIKQSFGANPTITNNIIILKMGGLGIDLGVSDSVLICNNLILSEIYGTGIENYAVQFLKLFNNYLNLKNKGIFAGTSDNIVKNNVVTNANIAIEKYLNQPSPVFKYNNLWKNNINTAGFTPDTTNYFVDPMILNDDTTQGELDFHLQAFSPLIDAGDPEMIDKDSSRIDIGLYGGFYGEVYKYQDLPPQPPRNLSGKIDSGMITIRWNPNTEADFSYYNLFRDTTSNFTTDSTTLVMSLTDTLYSHLVPSGIDKYYYKLSAIDYQGNQSELSEEIKIVITSVNTDEPTIFSSYILYQNYPNPFNPSTKISYKLKERGYVKLYVYAVSGELVSVLVNKTQDAGYYEVEFNAGLSTGLPLASGVYIYQIMVKNENSIPVFSDIKKMILIK